jgi:CRISPR-associated protein Cas5t
MKVLKVKIYQDLVNYKKPMSFKSGETYPLPPPSTVNGFLHNAINADKYIPMCFSIQGNYKSITSNLQTLYKFGGIRKDKGKIRDYWAVIDNTKIDRMVYYVNLLVGVSLIIHINSSEETLRKLEDALVFPKEYLSLGRKEDLVRIDEIKIIEVEEKEDNWQGIKIKNPIYIPKQIALKNNLQGINYRLNSTYEIVDNFKKWDVVEMLYVETGKIYNKVFVDNDDDILFWHKDI